MVMPSSSTDFFSPPLFSPFSFCPCSPLLFFFLLSRSPHYLLLLFLSFLPSSSLSPPSALASWWCCCSRWFTVAASPLQTKMTVWKGCSTNTAPLLLLFLSSCSTNTASSPPVPPTLLPLLLFFLCCPVPPPPFLSPHCHLSSLISPTLRFGSSSGFYSQRTQVFCGNGRRASQWQGMSAAKRAP